MKMEMFNPAKDLAWYAFDEWNTERKHRKAKERRWQLKINGIRRKREANKLNNQSHV